MISDYVNCADRRIAGSFLTLGESLEEKRAKVLGDGFGLLLPAEEGGQFQDELAEGNAFDVTDSRGEPVLRVRLR